MERDMSERQRSILEYIRLHTAETGIPPTMREIGERCGIASTNGVEKHLQALERMGLIARSRGKSRGIALRSASGSAVSIPLVGRIAAGLPVISPENREGEIAVDLSLFSLKTARNVFALVVRGDSMINAHILDGDTVIVQEQHDAQNGDIIAALVDGEATVKRFFRESGRIKLQPENESMKPLYFDKGDFRIIGKVVGIMRKI